MPFNGNHFLKSGECRSQVALSQGDGVASG